MIQDAFIRLRAKQLYWQGYPPAEISRLMGISSNTVYSWKKRDEWDETPPIQRVTQSIDARLCQLNAKDNKTGGDFKEIDLLTRAAEKAGYRAKCGGYREQENQSPQEEKSLY